MTVPPVASVRRTLPFVNETSLRLGNHSEAPISQLQETVVQPAEALGGRDLATMFRHAWIEATSVSLMVGHAGD